MQIFDKREAFRILNEWNLWNKDFDLGTNRPYYLEKLKSYIDSDQVVVVSGARRSGKSYLLRQLADSLVKRGVSRKDILFVNFEDSRWTDLNAATLDHIYETYKEFLSPGKSPYIFLDEIQEVSGWEKWVRMIHELKKARLVISGSNSKLLGKELATSLTGRHIDLTVYPLSLKEFLSFRQMNIGFETDLLVNKSEILGIFREYLEWGGFPVTALGKSSKSEWLLAYFDDLIEKDLVRRHKIRKSEKLKSLAKFYLSNISSLTTFNSAGKFLQISPDTAEKFAGYFEESFFLFFLKRFSFKVKEQEKSPRKTYAIDTGLAHLVGFRTVENFGRSAENAVFLEFLRKKIIQPELELYYWKDQYHYEVDFVIKKGQNDYELFQVCADIFNEKTKQREVRSLLKAMAEFKIDNGLILTEDIEKEERVKQKIIQYVPLWKWLLAAGGN